VEEVCDDPALVRPVGREDVVGAPPEKQGVHTVHAGYDLLAGDIVDEWGLPAAEGKSAVRILFWAAGCLRDAVDGAEQVDVNESHDALRSEARRHVTTRRGCHGRSRRAMTLCCEP